MTQVSVDDLRHAFDALREGKKTREDVADWATDLIHAEDRRELTYEPRTAKVQIFEGIKYLAGIDMLGEDDSFFDSEDDIAAFRAKHGI